MKKLHKVILFLPSGREHDRGLLRGIIEFAHLRGPWIFYEEPPAYLSSPGTAQRLAHIQRWKADGMIALQDRQKEIEALRLPTVTIVGSQRLPANQYQVMSDNENIGKMAASHLLGLGLRQFAYCGLEKMEWSADRAKGFIREIDRAGLPTSVYSRSPGKHSGEHWYTEEMELGNWLKALPKPIGLMACNDDLARMIAEICRINNLRVPDDIAIIGVDNDEHVCRRATPPLSSIALATESAGFEVAAMLNELMAGRKPANRCILVKPTSVVTRQSTDLIAADDPNIVKALRFIKSNANRVIKVSDVAEAAGLSRRVLQDRFADIMHRTVLDEIHRTRIEHICRLLTETNLSIFEIAEAIGYPADAHIARFFSRQTGMTPYEYRRKHKV